MGYASFKLNIVQWSIKACKLKNRTQKNINTVFTKIFKDQG